MQGLATKIRMAYMVKTPHKILIHLLVLSLGCLLLPINLAAQWNVQSSGTNGDIYEVHFADERNGVAAVWVKPGAAEILRTDNGGATWTKPLSDINQGMTGVRMLDQRKSVVIGGTTNFSRVFRSEDGGNTWLLRVDDAASTPAFWAVDFLGNRDGFVAGGQGYIMSTIDGGSSWSPATALPGGTHVLDLDMVDLRTVYAVTSPTASNFWSGSQLYRTTDAGINWELVNTFPQIQAIEFVDDQIGYAAGSAGGATIWKTLDGGTTWTPVFNKPGSSQTFMDICVTPENPFVLYAVGGSLFDENDPVIVRTQDGGFSWAEEDVNVNVLLRKVHFPVETEGFACGTDGTIIQTSREEADLPRPMAEFSATELAFGDLDVGDNFTMPLNIESASAAELVIERIEFVEQDAAARGFSLDFEAQLPLTLAGGGMLTVNVNFEAMAAGEQKVDLIIETNSADNPLVTIPLSGSGVETLEPGIIVDQSQRDFGEIEENTSTSRTVNIRASNAAGLEIQSLEILGDGFVIVDGPALPATVNEEPGLDVQLNFEPSAAGDFNAELVILSNAGETRIALVGKATKTSTGVATLPGGGVLQVELGPNPAARGQLRTAHVSVPRAGMLQMELVDLRGVSTVLPSVSLRSGAIMLPFEIPMQAGGHMILRCRFESTTVTVPILTLP